MRTIQWLLVSLTIALFAPGILTAAEARPDLNGLVTLQDGMPVPKATVFIYTAGPKTGSAVVCPSCYPDCAKRATTDADGRFTIRSLDPKLLFRLLVAAAGHESAFVTKVDPAEGDKNITIKRLSEEALKSPTRMTGVVIDEDGAPVVGAVVGPEGVQRGSGTQWGGTDKFVDPLAVTDERGYFVLFCKEGVDVVHAVVEGRNVAKRWVELKPGRDHFIRMQEGVLVTGRIERDRQPLKEVMVGLVTADRTCGNFFRGDELATDKEGFFAIPNIPPGREFVLYAKMDSLRGQGAIAPKVFTTGKSGATADLGALVARPAHRLAGRVVSADGKPIPPDTWLLLGLERAWDHSEALLNAEGQFEFRDVPAESISMSIRVKGYKFSKRNPNLDWLNGGIVGRIDRDLTDLTLVLEPGEWRHKGDEGDPPDGDRQPREKPLRSAKL